ncbi:MAG: acyl-ACP--UDP-N-acetylglucosamine O-acyltransferase [Holosporaceae bacterium]|jgi:UDP-N-acetylglucosamine acyltransferase|nr:acyl-ACP--UDP-N-acetylglucosamine O-acyltransferase [Holosporaceae bacterium]
MIHPTAIVSSSAQIAENVKIGPYSVIGNNVMLEEGVEVSSHVCIDGYTRVGRETRIFPFATIGFAPQDLKFKGEKTCLIIGEHNIIREYVTIHLGTKGGIGKTVVGDGNLFMVGVHIAHDCVVENNVVMGNNATLGGHVVVGDDVIIGGLAAIHQWTRIGCGAIIGGMSGVEKDVIPYGAVKGERAHIYDINIIGLRRAGVEKQEIFALKKAYEIIFSGQDTIYENIEKSEKMFGDRPYVKQLIDFMKKEKNRSFCLPKK